MAKFLRLSAGVPRSFDESTTFLDTAFAVLDASDNTKKILLDASGTTNTKTTILAAQTADRVLTLPDITDTLIGRITTDQSANRLQNKHLSANNVIFVDPTDTAKHIAFDASGVTSTKTATIAANGSQTLDATFTLPPTTANLVGDTSTQTLSNKTLNNTTVLAIKDANLEIQDDTDTTKKLTFQLSGETTNKTATLSFVNTNNATYTFPLATTTIVGLDSTQTLTNKTIAAGSNTISGLTNTNLSGSAGITVANGGTGAASFTSNGMLYGNSTSAIQVTAAGNQYESFQAGASGVPTVGPIQLAQGAATTGALLATRGGTAQSTWTLGDILYSSATDVLSKLAGNTTTTKKYLTQTGNGSVSAAPGWNTIAAADLSGITNTQLSGSAGITGANIATNTVANTNLSQMAANTIKGNNTGSTANAADLTTAQVNALLGVNTVWATATFTGSWNTNTTYTGKYRRVGDSMEAVVLVSLTGAPNATNLTITIPDSLSIDTTKLASTSAGREVVGLCRVTQSGVSTVGGSMHYDSSTTVRAISTSTTAPTMTNVTSTAPYTFANTDFISLRFTVPISGWSI